MALADSKIAVIGGGLGGMSFMNAALFAGLRNVDMYEQAQAFKEVGAGVNITRNANRILDAYGLKDGMLWKSSRNPPCYMEYRNYRTGEYVGQIDEFGDPRTRQIHRAHLLDVLKERIPSSRLHTSKKLDHIETRDIGTRYLLHFVDGSTAEADIVIGCDGIKSKVRQHLGFADEPIYSGQTVYRGYVSYDDLPKETAETLRKTVIFRGQRKHILTLPVGNEESKTARVGVIGFMTESLDTWSSESWMSRAPIDDFEDHIKGWTTACQDIVAGLRKDAQDNMMLKQALYVREPLPKWYTVDDSRAECGIVLLGDSAHSTLPHQGQGACMAIESGVALAIILKNWKSPDTEGAFAFYQNIRKPRTDRVTKTSAEAGRLASADNAEIMTETFNPEALKERMKWIMDYDMLADVYAQGKSFFIDGYDNGYEQLSEAGGIESLKAASSKPLV